MFEIIKLVRPTWIIAENVAGHIKLGLDKVLFDLESEGYSARAVVIPACAKNAPHRRDRVWIIANNNSERREGSGKKQIQRQRTIQGGENVRRIEREVRRSDLHTPKLCRRGNGVSERLDAIGNAIVPQVAYEIMKAMLVL